MAPCGPKVPHEAKDGVEKACGDLEVGTAVVFIGPVIDQDRNVKVAEGDVYSSDVMGSMDWSVKGVVGSPK